MQKTKKSSLLSRRHFLLTLGAAGSLAAVGGAFPQLTNQAAASVDALKVVNRSGFAFGTTIKITALHEDHAIAKRAIDAAFAELQTVQSVMSLYLPDSQLNTLNRKKLLTDPHPYLMKVLRAAQHISQANDGDFDITVQPLWKLYKDASNLGLLPTEQEIDKELQRVDWRKVRIFDDHVELQDTSTAITLNGIAQGFAADCMVNALQTAGVQHALVDTGEIGGIGTRSDGNRWLVGIKHPRNENSILRRARLDGRFLATSGDYETTFTSDYTHNHIFNPATGRSPAEFQGVTVLANTGLEADALSTAVFVAGLEKGLKLIEAHTGADALFVLKNGKITATAGFPADG